MPEYHAQTPALLQRGDPPVMEIEGFPVMGLGRMRRTPGWQPKHMLIVHAGRPVMIEYKSREFVVARGTKGRRLVRAPARMQRDLIVPKIVKAESEDHEAELRKRGAIPATEMPNELKDLIIDAYAGDYAPDMLAIIGGRIEERGRERTRSAEKALPARAPTVHRQGAAPRGPAGCARPDATPKRRRTRT